MELKDVSDILAPYLEAHDLSLYEILWVKEYGYQVLRVSVDLKNGHIDVDTLALVNDFLSAELDKIDDNTNEYMLEVCSPGAEKVLRDEEEVLNNVGSYVNVRVTDNVYEGLLVSFVDNVLTVQINIKGRMKMVEIKYEDIKKIRLAVKF